MYERGIAWKKRITEWTQTQTIALSSFIIDFWNFLMIKELKIIVGTPIVYQIVCCSLLVSVSFQVKCMGFSFNNKFTILFDFFFYLGKEKKPSTLSPGIWSWAISSESFILLIPSWWIQPDYGNKHKLFHGKTTSNKPLCDCDWLR